VKQRSPWLVCVFVPLIVLDLQLAIYCDALGYKVHTYNTEELDDDKKNSFPGTFFLTICQKSPGDKEIRYRSLRGRVFWSGLGRSTIEKKGLTKCTANGFVGSLFQMVSLFFRYVVLHIPLYLGSKGTNFF
jgi:hypothetical protein